MNDRNSKQKVFYSSFNAGGSTGDAGGEGDQDSLAKMLDDQDKYLPIKRMKTSYGLPARRKKAMRT